MKCIRCRIHVQRNNGLCERCYSDKSNISKREQAILELYKESQDLMGFMGYNYGQEDQMVDEFIIGMDNDGNIDREYMLMMSMKGQEDIMREILGPDYVHILKRNVTQLVGDDYFGEKVEPHPEVDSRCSNFFCNKTIYELCEHLPVEIRIKTLYELQEKDELEKLKEQFQKGEDKEYLVDIELYLIKMEVNNSRYHDAMEDLQVLKQENTEDPIISFKISTIEMHIMIEIDFEKCIPILESLQENASILKTEEIEKLSNWQAYMMTVTGLFFMKQNNLDKALEMVAQATQVYKYAGDKFGIAQGAKIIGGILIRKEQLDDAEMVLNEALNLFSQLKVKREVEKTKINLAILYGMKEEYSKAEYILDDVIQYFSNLEGSEKELVAACTLSSQISLSNGNFEKAETMGNKAISYATQIDDLEKIIVVISSMIIIYVRNGIQERAQSYCMELLNIIKQEFGEHEDVETIIEKLEDIIKLVYQVPDSKNEDDSYLDELSRFERGILGQEEETNTKNIHSKKDIVGKKKNDKKQQKIKRDPHIQREIDEERRKAREQRKNRDAMNTRLTSSPTGNYQKLPMFCTNCGFKFNLQDKFCTQCGKSRMK